MRVCLTIADASLHRALAQELRGYDDCEITDATQARIVVLDGDHPELAEQLRTLAARRPPPRILLLANERQLDAPPPEVDEVARKPLNPGELRGRLRLMTRRGRRTGSKFELLLATAVESAGDIIEITNPDPRFEYVNPAFTRILGWQPEDILGKTPAAVMRSDMHEPGYFKSIDETLSSGRPWQGLLISRTRDNRLVYLESTIAPVTDDEGNVTHHVAVKRDITGRIAADNELRRQSEELEQARDAALEASRSKSQFLANMSHELRTPLNAIIGYSEMLIEDARASADDELAEDLDRINKSGQHLLSLINDVLDISKIEAGAMELYLEDFAIATAIGAVTATVAPLMKSHDNDLVIEIDPSLSTIRADLTKVRQTLLNLLSNASKFTDHGKIVLRATPVTHEGRACVQFDVVDTGIGIEPEAIGRLFRPFSQADASTTRKFGGTGLGLAISQRFCEMMGGGITVSSVPGEGSTFSVRLPLRVDEAPTAPVRPRASGPDRQLHVVVIDDDADIRDLLERSLARHSIAVRTAAGGREGLAQIRAEHPDAIVLDVMMPELNGWGVLTELKADPATADIPVIMLTSLGQSDIGFALGAVDFLVKPVPAERLASVLRRHARPEAARVLVVDDDEAGRMHVRRKLESAGHTVYEAADGQQGIEAMLATSPDLVLLDLMMPVLDGFAVLQRMRGTPQLEDIPVVVVTAKDLSAAERTMLAGARAVIERSGHPREELARSVSGRVAQLLGV